MGIGAATAGEAWTDCSRTVAIRFASTRPINSRAWNMAYDSCGACLSSSEARIGSLITSAFICDRISSN